ncbi:MAG: crossover junction endodeoxyribonuclease RuvC [Pirellulaceae bacterium]|jgi:crossover junction endodeoxyribonuclease RuvC
MAEQGTRILGIDPGLNITGYGVIEVFGSKSKLVEGGVVRSTQGRPIEYRINQIYAGVAEVIAEFSPESVAVEQLYSHYQRPQTAILMGHARGVICLAAAQADLEVSHYAATQIKKVLTGSGHAPKSQMQMAICREFGLAAPPEPADVADALAIALCHRHLGGMLKQTVS